MTTITSDKELLEQALAALECAYSENYDGAKIYGAKVAIRDHLAQPQGEPEPVAYRYRDGRGGLIEWVTTTIYANAQAAGDYEPLFTHPAHTEAEVQELFAAYNSADVGESEATIRRILGVPA